MHGSVAAEEHFQRGKALLADGDTVTAFEHFRTAVSLMPRSPRYQSYYGLGLALVDRRFDRAVGICRAAAKEEFFNPELYLNLARVHGVFGFKGEAIRFLRRGLMIDPSNAELLAERSKLGVRLPPVLGFLPRGHLVNRILGQLRRRVPSQLRAAA